MKYLVRKSFVNIIGHIWQPGIGVCAMSYPVSLYDIEHLRYEDGAITRDSIEDWLTTHSGDFRQVTDFSASIEDGEATIDIPWRDEESEFTYSDCMYPSED